MTGRPRLVHPTKELRRHYNSLINRRRGPGERAFATLKTWKVLAKVRCCPHQIGPMAQAIFTLQLGPTT